MTENTNKDKREAQGNQLDNIVTHIGNNLLTHAERVSIPDFIRIMQFAREFDTTETPREVKVTWVEHTRNSETEE